MTKLTVAFRSFANAPKNAVSRMLSVRSQLEVCSVQFVLSTDFILKILATTIGFIFGTLNSRLVRVADKRGLYDTQIKRWQCPVVQGIN